MGPSQVASADSGALALHTTEPEASAKYNLKVLYRRGSKKEKAEVAPAPTAGA